MKAKNFVLCMWLSIATFSLQAVEPYDAALDTSPITGDTAKESEENADVVSFWQFSAAGDYIKQSHFRTGLLPGQKIGFYESEELLAFNHYLDRHNVVSLGLAYGNTGIQWAENPFFHHHSFEDFSVTAAWQNTSFQSWLWRAIFTARFSSSARRVPDYVQYTQTLWGRYDLSSCYGVHCGYIAETGLSKDTVWPIIGFDYKYSDCIKFYAVYPIEASATYTFSKPWGVELAAKQFRYRQRMRVNEPLSKGLFEYRNFGTELRLVYEIKPLVSANVHIGQAWGGELRIANHKNQNQNHYKFRTAPYVGGEVTVRF